MEGNKVKKCTCYTCTHDDPHELAAYYTGYIQACGWFLNWAHNHKIKRGSIADDDLGGLLAQIEYNCGEAEYLLSEIKQVLGQ